MNALIINSSYSGKKGYTETVLNWIKDEIGLNNVNTRYTKEDRIGSCRGCRNCTFQAKGSCPLTDSMQIYMRYMKNSDLIVIGAPIYSSFISAKLKTFFERLRPLISGKLGYNNDRQICHLAREEHKYKILIVSICSFPEIENFEPSRVFFESLFNRFDFFKDMGGIYLPAFPYIKDNKPEILENIKNEVQSQIKKVEKNKKAFLYKEWIEKKEFEEYLKSQKIFTK